MKILQNREYNNLDDNQSMTRTGFRRGSSTMDHIHTKTPTNSKLNYTFYSYRFLRNSAHNRVWEIMGNVEKTRVLERLLKFAFYVTFLQRIIGMYIKMRNESIQMALSSSLKLSLVLWISPFYSVGRKSVPYPILVVSMPHPLYTTGFYLSIPRISGLLVIRSGYNLRQRFWCILLILLL